MPRTTRTYNPHSGQYELSCLTEGCSSLCVTGSAASATRESIDLRTGRPVHATFRFLGDGRGNSARCRTCERNRRQGRRNAPAAVPGMTRAADWQVRRFGVELELLFPHSVTRSTIDAALQAAGLVSWRAKTDVSIHGNGRGWEIVSPPLQGEGGYEQVRTACRVLAGLGGVANRSCGMHVHHDIRDLTVDGVKAVARMWVAQQPMIDGLVAPSRRGSGHTYLGPIRAEELRQIEACTNLEDVRRLASRISRYRNLNVAAYGRHGTIEMRQHQGTVNAEKVLTWVRLGQALIQAAAEQPETTRVPQPRMRAMLDLLGDRLGETARTFLIGRTVEFGLVQP